MLDGWYCRSMASMQADEAASASTSAPPPKPRAHRGKQYSTESSSEDEPEPNYKAQYLNLKKKLKNLIFENECFQDSLRSSQKRLLKVSRDRSFLLDRLLQYEKHDSSTSDSDETESSDDPDYKRATIQKRKKNMPGPSMPSPILKAPAPVRRKRAAAPKKIPVTSTIVHVPTTSTTTSAMMSKSSPVLGMSMSPGDGHMTPEEIERHLQSRQSYMELLPERAPPTVPTEMFSNDPSLDSESNDVLEVSTNVDEWFD